ncbi:holo-ACP synthase [Candidatus Micrarchaeota archaeon]|nr:holo-ACP synthase [Candidatus Micrarchaeota archaeon]
MSVAGVGIDIVSIKRMKKLISGRNGEAFLGKTFAEDEIGNPKNAEKLAGIFAAKEAVYKALGTGWINGKEIEVVNDRLGAPKVKLYGKTKRISKNKKINISISYEKEYAVAVAVISF